MKHSNYYAANRERLKSIGREYYWRNREQILERAREKRRAAGIRERGPYRPLESFEVAPLQESKYPRRKWDRPKLESRKKWAVDYMGGKCQKCGYDKCLYALEFDHIDRATKKYNISDLLHRRWCEETLKEELRKCQLLCANCHREKSAEAGDLG